jgi:hypothetical protein
LASEIDETIGKGGNEANTKGEEINREGFEGVLVGIGGA